MADPVVPGAALADVARRVLDRLSPLLDRLGAAYRTVPEYEALGPGMIEAEVLPVSREIVGGFLDAVAAGRPPVVEQVAALEQMGRRRLEMGVPLEPMLHVFRIAGREVFDEIASVTQPHEKAELAALGRAWMDYMDRASSAAASSYLQASHERLRRIDAHRGALLGSLLAAVDASDVAAVASEFAVALAHRYVVVLVAGAEVASHVDRIEAIAPVGSLTGFRGGEVVVLVPEVVPDLVGISAQVPDAVVVHGTAAEPGAALLAEVRRAELLLAAARARGQAGTYGPDALLLEQLVLSSPEVADSLRQRVLGPVRTGDRGGLVESTLRTFLRTGSIPGTAVAELVHANTVTYRLRRVAERAGFDPRIPEQAAVLSLALLADTLRPDL